MLIIALALAVIGLAALVFAVVTSNALVAWVCIGASLLGVLLLIADALRERRSHDAEPVDDATAEDYDDAVADSEGTDDSADNDDADGSDGSEDTAVEQPEPVAMIGDAAPAGYDAGAEPAGADAADDDR